MDLCAEGVTGGVGGLLGRTAAFPFDTLKVKLATTKDGSSLAATLKKLLVEEGPLGLYRGLPFSAFEGFYQKALYVLIYAGLKGVYRRLFGQSPAMLGTVLCGYLSDLCCVPFSMPFEAMVVRLQSAPHSASRAAIIRESFTVDGLVKSIKTGKAYFVLSLKPAVEFAIFERFKAKILEAGGGAHFDLAPSTGFVLGGAARGIATVLVYPYARGKALSQARLAPTAFLAIKQVFHTEGVWALYRGLEMELARGITQSAVMFAVMEKLRAAIKRLLLPELRPNR